MQTFLKLQNFVARHQMVDNLNFKDTLKRIPVLAAIQNTPIDNGIHAYPACFIFTVQNRILLHIMKIPTN